jgi:hypothetical protein
MALVSVQLFVGNILHFDVRNRKLVSQNVLNRSSFPYQPTNRLFGQRVFLANLMLSR